MIKGAIDLIGDNRIGGWLYSDSIPLRNHTVLAFVGAQCIGTGAINGFRQDLFDAGLGDGYAGFSFEISPVEGWQGRVIVRLEGSDLSLLQANSTVERTKPE